MPKINCKNLKKYIIFWYLGVKYDTLQVSILKEKQCLLFGVCGYMFVRLIDSQITGKCWKSLSQIIQLFPMVIREKNRI